MTLARIYNLYINSNKPGPGAALTGSGASQAGDDFIQWIQGDVFKLRIWFQDTSATGVDVATTNMQLEGSTALKLGGKVEVGDASFLFNTTTFTEGGTTGAYYYEGTLDLDTAEIATALASADSVTAICDLEYQNSGNTERITWRFKVVINKQAYDTAAGSTAATPPLLVYQPSSGNYFTVTLTADGQLEITPAS